MSAYNRMNVFFSQAAAAKQATQKPQQPNIAVQGAQSGTVAQQQQNVAGLQQTQQLAKDTAAPVLDKNLQKATAGAAQSAQTASAGIQAPTFSQSGQPQQQQQQQGGAPVSYSQVATGAQNTQQVNQAFDKAQQEQNQIAQTFQTDAQKAAMEAMQAQNQELSKKAQTNIADLAAASNFQTDQMKFLEAATQDPTSNVGLLSQMYMVDPNNMALESQARQGEINQLRSDAAQALSDRETAEGERETRNVEGKQEATEGMKRLAQAYQKKTDKIAKDTEALRKNPNLSEEARNKAIEKLNAESDKARNEIVKQGLGDINSLYKELTMDFISGGDGQKSIGKIDALYRQGVPENVIKDALAQGGLNPAQIEILTDPVRRNQTQQMFAAHGAKQRELEAARAEEQRLAEVRRWSQAKAGEIPYEQLTPDEQQRLIEEQEKNRQFYANVDNSRANKNAWRK